MSIPYQSLGRSKDVILSAVVLGVVVLGVPCDIATVTLGGCWNVCDADHTKVNNCWHQSLGWSKTSTPA